MGGNLFHLGRISPTRYKEIEASLLPYLTAKFENLYRIPRFYSQKPDFGDIDILISSEAIKGNWRQTCEEVAQDLGVRAYQSAGNVFSMNYENFQTDLFFVQKECFESTYNFMCFNDIGNVIGKIFHKFHLKYGEEGLAYVYRRADGHYKKDIPITQDFEKMMAFVGLDYAQWKKGFDTFEDMFTWVIQSPYFSIKPYLQPSANTEKRLKERKTMQAFVAWLEKEKITQDFDYEEDKSVYLPMIAAFFPEANLLFHIEQENLREKEVRIINEKFNGNIVREITGLEGKELGDFIVKFKAQFADFEAFIKDNEAEWIAEKIKTFRP